MIPLDTDLIEIIREIKVLGENDHPNVVRYYGSYLKESHLWIIMEFCGVGSVADVMRLLKKPVSLPAGYFLVSNNTRCLLFVFCCCFGVLQHCSYPLFYQQLTTLTICVFYWTCEDIEIMQLNFSHTAVKQWDSWPGLSHFSTRVCPLNYLYSFRCSHSFHKQHTNLIFLMVYNLSHNVTTTK